MTLNSPWATKEEISGELNCDEHANPFINIAASPPVVAKATNTRQKHNL